MTRTPLAAPDGLPRLSRGSHLSPEAGACFMEYASLLAGEPWSDQPKCTHPVVAEVARMVNDATSDAGRARLVPLIPSVIGLASDDPRVSARLVDRLVGEAEALGVTGPVLRWHRRRARRRLRRLEAGTGTTGRRLHGLAAFAYQEGPAMRAVDTVGHAVCALPEGRRDEALLALLVTAIDTVREARRPATPAAQQPAHPRGQEPTARR